MERVQVQFPGKMLLQLDMWRKRLGFGSRAELLRYIVRQWFESQPIEPDDVLDFSDVNDAEDTRG